MLYLIIFYLVGLILAYGFINLHNELGGLPPINPNKSFQSWYFLYQIYCTGKYK